MKLNINKSKGEEKIDLTFIPEEWEGAYNYKKANFPSPS
jgi:hypothetical protein